MDAIEMSDSPGITGAKIKNIYISLKLDQPYAAAIFEERVQARSKRQKSNVYVFILLMGYQHISKTPQC